MLQSPNSLLFDFSGSIGMGSTASPIKKNTRDFPFFFFPWNKQIFIFIFIFPEKNIHFYRVFLVI